MRRHLHKRYARCPKCGCKYGWQQEMRSSANHNAWHCTNCGKMLYKIPKTAQEKQEYLRLKREVAQ